MARTRGRVRAGAGVLLAALAVSALGVAYAHGRAQADEVSASGGSTTSPALQRIVRRLVASGAPGAVAAVRTPTGMQRAAAGLARIRPPARMKATDRFRIASITKTFVATVVLQLAAEKRLRLNDPVDRWLPGQVPGGGAITLRELLGHTSGLFDYDHDEDWVRERIANPGREWSPRELVAIATSHPPLFAPGTSWAYSNTNYVVLGLVVEAVTGRTLERELRERIFRRLTLSGTSYPLGTAMPRPFAHGYVGSGSGVPVPAGTLLDVTSLLSPSAWGAGQMVSDADDLARFFSALLRGRLLPPAQLAAMKADRMNAEYGLGLRIAHTVCGTAFGNNGDIPGYRSVLWATSSGRRVVAVMVNVDTTRVSWPRLDGAAVATLCS
jgi:D-alanyl-D-alanine carboxypeptidase